MRQMLQKVEIDEIGETDLIQGEQIDRIELDEVNARAKEEGRKEATGLRYCSGSPKHRFRHARSSPRPRSRRPRVYSPKPQ